MERTKRIISMSLYGGGLDYHIGAISNAELAPKVYPGWVLRMYCETGHPAIPKLTKTGCEIIQRPHPQGIFGMSWRFEAISDPEAEYVIVRDVDSRLNPREKAAVDAWIASGKNGHLMRDHPHHTHFSEIWKIFGGMWGMRGGIINDMPARIADFKSWNNRADDMVFLTRYVWPEFSKSYVAHGLQGEPFPEHEPYDGFVGQKHDATGKGHSE